MSVHPLQETFVRGEISPRLHARAKLDLYQAGLSLCENFITLPHGGLRKRGGTYFVNGAIDRLYRSGLVPFIFSEDQAYCIEFGHLKLRVYAYGARVGTVELTTPWTSADVPKLDYAISGDVMWITHPDYEPRTLTRLSHTNWQLALVPFTDGPFQAVNTVKTNTMHVSAQAGLITVTSSSAQFAPEMVGQLIRIEMQNYTDIPPWEPGAVIDQPTAGTRRRYEGRVYETPTAYDNAAFEARTGATPPVHTVGTEWDGINSQEKRPDSDDLTLLDTYHGFQWTYLHSGFGIAKILSYVDPFTVTAETTTSFPQELVGGGDNSSYLWRLGAFSAGSYPGSVSLYEERLVYGEKYSVHGSSVGVFDNFETGEKADQAISFRNAGAGQANGINWLEELEGYLVMGTIGGARTLAGAGIDEALTPTSFKNRSSRAAPTENIQPVRAAQALLYVGKGRKKIFELRLGQQLRLESEDVAQISEHIPKKGVVEIAFQDNPDPMAWFPLDTGELGGMTYQPSQEVRGLHRHTLGGGIVESVCVTPGQNGIDDVWLSVRRTINGQEQRYIELMTAPFEYGAEAQDSFCVDCGLSYEGAAVGTVNGASHLASETVDVLAGNRVYRGLKVTEAGAVTLPNGATAAKWNLGLPFASDAESLELDVGGRDGSLVGRRKRVTKVILSVLETDLAGLQISSRQRSRWEPVKVPSIAVKDGTVQLYTGNVEVPIDDSWEGMGKVRIRHTSPTPCTIRAMTPAFDNEP